MLSPASLWDEALRQAAQAAKFVHGLGVKLRTTTVALAFRNPLGKDEAANRRSDIYWLP